MITDSQHFVRRDACESTLSPSGNRPLNPLRNLEIKKVGIKHQSRKLDVFERNISNVTARLINSTAVSNSDEDLVNGTRLVDNI